MYADESPNQINNLRDYDRAMQDKSRAESIFRGPRGTLTGAGIASQAGAPCQSQRPEIEREMERLSGALEALQINLSELLGRLAPVTQPVSVGAGGCQSAASPVGTPLGAALSAHSDKLEALSQTLRDRIAALAL